MSEVCLKIEKSFDKMSITQIKECFFSKSKDFSFKCWMKCVIWCRNGENTFSEDSCCKAQYLFDKILKNFDANDRQNEAGCRYNFRAVPNGLVLLVWQEMEKTLFNVMASGGLYSLILYHNWLVRYLNAQCIFSTQI